MSKKIFISGIGMISSIGNNIEDSLASLLETRHGIKAIEFLETKHRGKIPVGEVKASNETLSQRLNLPTKDSHSRTTLLGTIAAREALVNSGVDLKDGLRTGLISVTTVGGIDQSADFYREFLKDTTKGKLRHISKHDCGDSTENIADDLGIYHFVSTISTACSSSANSIMMGARMIRHNLLDRVLVGGTDALTRYTLNGFNALKILDPGHCKPFDQNRKGLNLGEGAAFVLLESEKSIRQRKYDPICELTGYGNSNDAYHQTASSPEGKGALGAMKLAIKTSALNLNDIDYVNAHGTATYINDLSEGNALATLFKERFPKIGSTKSFTGHTLAAAGSIEAVISILSLKHNFIAPNLNFSQTMEEVNIQPVKELIRDVNIYHILSNSFGFGGNCSALIISKL